MDNCGTCAARRGMTCHRFPPGLLSGQVRVWPTIAPEDWCGEYKPTYQEWQSRMDRIDASRSPWWKFWGRYG